MHPGMLYSHPQKRTTQIPPSYPTGEKKMLNVKGEKKRKEDKNETPKLLKTGGLFKNPP
ncbi:MAG: hypothetical protein LBK62_00770 [Treponema sp.]|jgi:hypothetical protein|nr:hypothetical protein [Treponema sp.]